MLGVGLIALTSCNRCRESAEAPLRPAGPSLQLSEVVLYEVFVRDYSVPGTFDGIRVDLDRIRDMGVNAIWLMPVHPVGQVNANGTHGSPYAVADYRDVHPEMGTLDNFKQLVDAAHERGMAIILDWVANHTAWDNPWIVDHPDWYSTDGSGNIIHPPGTNWLDVADLNYDSGDMQAAMLSAMKFWVNDVGVDGFRFDYAAGVPADFWQAVHSEWSGDELILLAEGEEEWLHTQAGFDLSYSWTGLTALKQVLVNQESAYRVGEAFLTEQTWLPEGDLRLRFSSNHDETSWEAPAAVLYGGIEEAKVAQGISAFLPGVPMFYNGQEVGSIQYLNLFEKIPLDWTTHPDMEIWYSKLFGARSTHPALIDGEITFRWLSNVFVADRSTASGRRALLVANVRSSFQSPNLEMYGDSMDDLVDIFTGDSFSTDLQLAPYELRLYLD